MKITEALIDKDGQYLLFPEELSLQSPKKEFELVVETDRSRIRESIRGSRRIYWVNVNGEVIYG